MPESSVGTLWHALKRGNCRPVGDMCRHVTSRRVVRQRFPSEESPHGNVAAIPSDDKGFP